MLVAMGLTAALCIAIGILPGTLYGLLPYGTSYEPYTFEHIVTQLQMLAFAALTITLLLRMHLYPPEIRAINLDTDWLYRVLGYNVGSTMLILASDTWRFITATAKRSVGALDRYLHYHHSPEGILGRTWPTGIMAFWATLMLGGYLLMSYID